MKYIELFGFGLHLSSSVVSFPYLNCLPPQRSSSSPRGTKILEGSFQFLNKQIILIKSVAVTLFVSTVLTTTEKLPSQRICPSLSAFQNVTTDSAHSSYFNIADTYSLEHSGRLSSRTCHFLRFCLLDGCLSCPKWIIPSHVAAWHTATHLLLQLCLKEWFHMSLCQLSTHASRGWPCFIWDAQQLLRCHAVNHLVDLSVSGCLVSLLQDLLVIDLLLPSAIKLHV